MDNSDDSPSAGGRTVKFLLEVDMGDTAFDGNAARELGRILRYWGGNLHHYELKPGDGSAVYDAAYNEVGHWSVVDVPAAGARPES